MDSQELAQILNLKYWAKVLICLYWILGEYWFANTEFQYLYKVVEHHQWNEHNHEDWCCVANDKDGGDNGRKRREPDANRDWYVHINNIHVSRKPKDGTEMISVLHHDSTLVRLFSAGDNLG